jgi:hypothetical protein
MISKKSVSTVKYLYLVKIYNFDQIVIYFHLRWSRVSKKIGYENMRSLE